MCFTGFPENTGELHIGPPISPLWGYLFGPEKVPAVGHVTFPGARKMEKAGPRLHLPDHSWARS